MGAEHAEGSPLVVHASVHRVQHGGVVVLRDWSPGSSQLFPHIGAVCELRVPGRNPHLQACEACHDYEHADMASLMQEEVPSAPCCRSCRSWGMTVLMGVGRGGAGAMRIVAYLRQAEEQLTAQPTE